MADTAELTSEITVGEGIFYMKVGTHAGKTIEQIVERKQAEIARYGSTYWGYGGSNCHPLSIVQPFADELRRDGAIRLMMEETHATHFAVDRVATQFSLDGVNWHDIPDGIKVRGSRYALVIDKLTWSQEMLPLQQTEVAVGPSSGRRGDHYVTGLVDKACLKVIEPRVDDPTEGDVRSISLVASVRAPFAVFLREPPQTKEDEQ